MRSRNALGEIRDNRRKPAWLNLDWAGWPRGIISSSIFSFVAVLLFSPINALAQDEGLRTEGGEGVEIEHSNPAPPPRAESELRFVEEPTLLIVTSPFYRQISGGVDKALRRASVIDPSRRKPPHAKRPFSLAGRSPLIGGGAKNPRALGRKIPGHEGFEDSANRADAAIERQQEINAYNAEIAKLEGEGGVWNENLVEELHSLGTLLQQQGEHEDAIQVFNRAVHIDRINSGLHSEGQISSVENKIESLLALNRWNEADMTYEYLYYIQRRAYGDNDPRLIPILDRIAQWNLRAFFIGHGEALGLRLSNALMFYNAAASMVQKYFGAEDERFVAYLRGIANSSYLVSRHPELMLEIERPEYRSVQSMMRQQLMQTDRAVTQGFSSGAQALMQILKHELETRDDAIELADAFANLGDWYLLFGRRQDAAEYYANAWNLLSNQPNAIPLINAYFGRVVAMPTFAGEDAESLEVASVKAGNASLRSDYADIMFDVSDNGVVRNVRMVSAETEENRMQLSKLRRMVRDSYFRPLIKDGVPQNSKGNVMRYRYWY